MRSENMAKIALNVVRLPKFEPVNGISWSPRKIMVKDLRQRVILRMRRELRGRKRAFQVAIN